MEISLREQNKIKCRAKILWASRRLFKSKGYEETMITDVAEMAMISKATFYNYFPSKESLLPGIVEEEFDILRKIVAIDLKDEEDPLVKIRKIMVIYVQDILSYLSIARRIPLLHSSTGHPDKRINALLLELVSEARERGDFRRDIPAEDIVGILLGVCYLALFEWPDGETYSPAQCEEKVLTYLDRVFAGVLEKPRR